MTDDSLKRTYCKVCGAHHGADELCDVRRKGDGLCCARTRGGKGPFCRLKGKHKGLFWLTYCERHRPAEKSASGGES